MRVQLQTPQPSAAPPSTPPTPKPELREVPQPAPPEPVQTTAWERLLTAATRWHVAIPVLLLCAVAITWALYFRLPASDHLLKVHARSAQPSGGTNRLFTAEEVSAMREQMRERAATLITHRKEIPPLLSKLDARARELGWRCDASLKPPIAAPGGVKELTLHPVSIELRYDYVQPERAYNVLLAWLWTVSSLQPRAEVASLKLQSLGHGLNSAQVELNFFSLNSHEENPPK